MLDYWERVTKLISKQDTKQSWLAEKAGVLQQTLSQWIIKDRFPNVKEGQKIAEALGTTVEYLVTGRPPSGISEEIMVIVQELENLNEEGKRAALGAVQGLRAHYPQKKEEKPLYTDVQAVSFETKEPEPAYMPEDRVILLDWNVVMIPYYGKTAAGKPVDISVAPEYEYPFPENAIHGDIRDYFCLTICGTSMTEANIQDGDIALIRHAEEPEDGEIMLVRYGNESTLKRIRIRREAVYLCWEDGSGQEIRVDSEEYEIQGRIVNMWRKPRKR